MEVQRSDTAARLEAALEERAEVASRLSFAQVRMLLPATTYFFKLWRMPSLGMLQRILQFQRQLDQS